MVGEEHFELETFITQIKRESSENQRHRTTDEIARVSQLTVREANRRVQQQLYLQRLKRLARFLAGDDVTAELTPSEMRAYNLLAVQDEPPGESDRRRSLRAAMKTRVRVRRGSVADAEVLAPLNVSRGGLGFESARPYQLHEMVWVTLHYNPQTPDDVDTEIRGIIVRAAPLPEYQAASYGVRFLD